MIQTNRGDSRRGIGKGMDLNEACNVMEYFAQVISDLMSQRQSPQSHLEKYLTVKPYITNNPGYGNHD